MGAAVAKLFSLALFGFIFTRFEIISEKGLNEISKLLIYFTLPCLIFSSFLTKFETAKLPNWWIWILAGATLRLVTLSTGYIVSNRFPQKERKQLTCMMGRHYGGKLDFLNQGILYSYLTATLTIPLMISLLYLLENL